MLSDTTKYCGRNLLLPEVRVETGGILPLKKITLPSLIIISKMRSTIILLFILMSIAGNVSAQKIKVTGTVSSTSDEPLIGATVFEKGSSNTAVTLKNGQYSITVPSDAILVVSYINYESKEVAVKGQQQIDVSLAPEDKSLDQVVVVGYGTQKRRDITGAVSSVSGNELDKVPVQNVEQALQGRLAGVQVTTSEGSPGSMPSIKIRGGGSITQSNEPLYVVDGVPQTEGLNFLDPTDVESVDILKDASATAIYGARGANGVVLVTTKKAKAGKTKVSYDMYYGSKRVPAFLTVLSPYDYTILQYERSLGDATRMNAFISNYGPFDTLKGLYSGRTGISWQEEVFGGNANSQYHKVGISGGSKETQFNLFYSHNNDEGIMLNSGARKNVVKLSLNHKASEKMTLTASANYTHQNIFGVGTSEGNTYFNQLQNILTYRPTFGIKGSDDALVDLEMDPALESVSGNTLQNPVINAISQTRQNLNKTLVLNGTLSYLLLKNITYRGTVGYRTTNIENSVFNDARSMLAKRNNGPLGSILNNERNGWNYSNTVNYVNSFNDKHKLDVLIGQEQIYAKTKIVNVDATGFDWENLGLNDISQAKTFLGNSNIEDERMFSLFSRLNYGYADKYMLTASMRADGSSKFGANHKYGYFPALALMWRMNRELFMENVSFISDFRWRFSLGTSGNNRIPNYSSLALFATGNYPLNDGNTVTVYPNVLPNPDLKWEQTTSKNIGLDLGFLKQRIQLTADYYLNKTKDLLLRSDIPTTTGFKTMFINAGSTQNKGLEITLNTVNVRKKDFEWSSSFNIAFNKNKVLGLTGGSDIMYAQSGWGVLTVADYLIQVGQPLGQMYGYKSDGLYQVSDFDYNETTRVYTLKPGIPYDVNNRPQPGFLKLVDVSGDTLINENDRVVIGNAYPKHTGGFNNSFRYKGLDLNIFVSWSFGNDIYNANKLYNSQTYLDYRNTLSYISNRWMSVDKNTGARITDPAVLNEMNKGKTIPVYNGSGTSLKFYDQMVEDGSFLRLSNINLGYTLPKRIAAKVKASGLRVYVTANNIYTFTKYTGYDPEVSTRNSTGLTPGVDFGAYPRTRSFVIGANLSL